MFTTSHKPLAPGRVRCRCCQRSMQRLKTTNVQVHMRCLTDHAGSMRCQNRKVCTMH